MDYQSLATEFHNTFGKAPTRVFFSPGRINLIGEHTDYNGGHVFPCAISLGTYGAVAPRSDRTLRLFSANFPDSGIQEVSLDALTYQADAGWVNYPKGMIYELAQQGITLDHGFDLFIHGDLPDGAGLSSSASIELLIGEIVKALYHPDIEPLTLVKAGQLTENDYIGLNSGIMDQFAVGMGRPNQAILLDTNTLAYDYAPVALGDSVIVIMNTNKRRELADSKYNERRAECDEALRRIQTQVAVNTLGDLSEDAFDQATSLIDDATLIKRARHAVIENQRTLRAHQALSDNDLTAFGQLVNASHVSLHYDYEVTGQELDTLVAAAWQQPGVAGARMTGAGFGGCAIAIVEKATVEAFETAVGQAYEAAIGYAPTFYVAHIAGGPAELTE